MEFINRVVSLKQTLKPNQKELDNSKKNLPIAFNFR